MSTALFVDASQPYCEFFSHALRRDFVDFPSIVLREQGGISFRAMPFCWLNIHGVEANISCVSLSGFMSHGMHSVSDREWQRVAN